MEVPHEQEDVLGYHSSSSTGDCGPYGSTVTKRKRTQRRQRTAPAAPVLSSSSANSSLDFSTEATTTEEEDMAHCLILLAHGGARAAASPEKFTSRRFNETATTAGGKAGFYVYECKTCNKCFPTFQALGGHRASHKRPKIAAEENKLAPLCLTNPLTPAIADASKLRVHECSICRAEFSSGQALGGHMRRHRPIVVGSSTQNREIKKLEMKDEDNNNNNNIVLALDLNLPAPCDEINSGMVGFTFAAAATSALVDCHY